MRQSRPLLPIRPLVLPARLGRRQHWQAATFAVSSDVLAVRTRAERSNLNVALSTSPVWLRGPLFVQARLQPSPASTRHAA